jgi:ferredoxin
MNVIYITIGIAFTLWLLSALRRKRTDKIIHILDAHCVGCGRCVKRCPRRVLEMIEDGTGKHAIVTRPSQCTACGDCLPKCRFNALELIKRN